MHTPTTPKRKKFRFIALASTAVVGVASMSALLAGVTPATAANLAAQPDTQIAVFMVPLTLLVLAVLFEVVRFARRGNLPAHAPARRRMPRDWSENRNDH